MLPAAFVTNIREGCTPLTHYYKMRVCLAITVRVREDDLSWHGNNTESHVIVPMRSRLSDATYLWIGYWEFFSSMAVVQKTQPTKQNGY